MRQYHVQYQPGFIEAAAEIFDYVFYDLENPLAAINLVRNFFQKCDALSVFPKGYAVRARKAGREFRTMRVKMHVVVFWVDDKTSTVYIHDVFYARQDIDAKLKKPPSINPNRETSIFS